jgi:DNA-binding beta-propeller fold protein YncE
MHRMTTAAVLFGLLLAGSSSAADLAPLTLEAKIPLGTVSGRIDHFALDADHKLLYVAELGNDSVAIIDLDRREAVHRIPGLREPQGVAFHAGTGTLYVANGGDGSVRLFQAWGFEPIGRIELGSDADNIRLDPWRNRIVVGYGKGGLALIDPSSRRKIGDIPLDGHPESFQFDETGSRIFVNVPDAAEIAGIDAVTGKKVTLLENAGARSNFAMAVDADQHRVIVAVRNPARLVTFDSETGKRVATVESCRDADDLFVDARRHRLYVSCGEGVIDVFADTTTGYERIARISTIAGARTSLFVAGTDRLYLGVRGTAVEPAAIWVFRPQP